MEKRKYIYPNRQDAVRGAHIPAWILTLGLPAELMVAYAVMARCAGSRRDLTGFSMPRLAAIAGVGEDRMRKNISALVGWGLIERFQKRPGTIPAYRFLRHPRSLTATDEYLTWKGLIAAVDAAAYAPNWKPS